MAETDLNVKLNIENLDEVLGKLQSYKGSTDFSPSSVVELTECEESISKEDFDKAVGEAFSRLDGIGVFRDEGKRVEYVLALDHFKNSLRRSLFEEREGRND